MKTLLTTNLLRHLNHLQFVEQFKEANRKMAKAKHYQISEPAANWEPRYEQRINGATRKIME